MVGAPFLLTEIGQAGALSSQKWEATPILGAAMMPKNLR